MRSFLKKFNSAPHQSEDAERSISSRSNKSSGASSPDKLSPSWSHEHKPFSGLSNWLNSVANRKSPSPPSSSNVTRGDRVEPSDSGSSSGLVAASEAMGRVSESTASRDPDTEEEYQIQQALELSAREDPEAVQIEAIKQISLGSSAPANTPSEVVAYRYWNYDALGYDDKILDGFYDIYGTLTESTPESMPSLRYLQGTPVSDDVTWEAVVVNKAADYNLLKLEQKALEMAVKSRSESQVFIDTDLVCKLANLVSDYMGGSVGDPYNMSRAWRSLRYSLRATLGSMVLPLGSLTIGLPRHRALMFKFLADSVGIPCRLVKGHQYTGSADLAMNFVKIDDEREFIVDLMADPGTLIPPDAAGSHIECDALFSSSPSSGDVDSSCKASFSSGIASSLGEHSDIGTLNNISRLKNSADAADQSHGRENLFEVENKQRSTKGKELSRTSSEDFSRSLNLEKALVRELPRKPNYPNAHARSPSWTEGISSPAVHRKKIKDVSLYMIDAANENPLLAQKLHDVLLESGVVAPSNLFTQVSLGRLNATDSKSPAEDKDGQKSRKETHYVKYQDDIAASRFLVQLRHPRMPSGASPCTEPEQLKPAESFGIKDFDTKEIDGLPAPLQPEVTPGKYTKNVPVAAGAAVAACSTVVGVVKSRSDSDIRLPTATARVATPAAITKQYERAAGNDGDADSAGFDPLGSGGRGRRGQGSGDGVTGGQGSGGVGHDNLVATSDREKMCDRSLGSDSSSSDVTLDDVADCEINWEEIRLGERIGLGSYGEVYRGEWHGTEVAVKRLLDQGISGESLTEFISEVQIMKKLRHPNVVLFMGAVTRAPNLSIVTEFLPRGSLYRLIHQPNNRLDERRRLRMALDAARGMNYLHSCTPVIVHRDLKSPNLLVDKNWVVKVSDFGLSRMKNSTFLSSRSTAGTAEWMAPEMLRNEPANEKCDVFSFGVILWELFTLRQPWGGMNSMQVVGAVGFQHRRLEIPEDMDPSIADIIRNCLQTDPKLRPTFTEIMAALKPLQKPITAPPAPRPSVSVRSQHKKEAEDRTV